MSQKCPACGTDGAYVGFSDVECLNFECRHYKGPALMEYQKEFLRMMRDPSQVIVSFRPTGTQFAIGECYDRMFTKKGIMETLDTIEKAAGFVVPGNR